MGVLKVTAFAVLAAGAIFLPGAAASHMMNGSVGPGFTISLSGTAGLVPGEQHDIVVDDQGELHNFHLLGTPVVTGIESTGISTFKVTLPEGRYTYQCDVHLALMDGSFTVGTPPPAPPPPPAPAPKPVKLLGVVGPGAKIDLTNASGKHVGSLVAGRRYLVVVADRSAVDNFHLTGPGIDRKTGVKGKGTSRWALTFKRGVYRYRSDEHPKRARSFTAKRSS